MNPSAVCVKDLLGKMPIHYLFQNYADAFRAGNKGESSVEERMIQAMEALLEVDASIVASEDDGECTALEYAIESNAVVHRL